MKTELKTTNIDSTILEERFIYGLVLVGLSLIHDEVNRVPSKEDTRDNNETQQVSVNIEDKVFDVSRALAPIILPMINTLATVVPDEHPHGDEDSGEAA